MISTIRTIEKGLIYIGANDRRLERFENMFPLRQGVAYNSYCILDEKTCIVDTVDPAVTREYLDNIEDALDGRSLDYLVVNHMEPDHCGNIVNILNIYPACKMIGNKKTFLFFEQFYSDRFKDRYLEVSEGTEICLGENTLRFYTAPMVHWPEVMMTFVPEKGWLFSSDAFGSFNCLEGNIFSDEVYYEEDWLEEARRYYINIVGKYGRNVLQVFKKLPLSEIRMLLSLHGTIHRTPEDIQRMVELYTTWASYEPERKGVVLFYASMYGDTENACYVLAKLLAERGIKGIHMYDISKTDDSYMIADAFRYSHIVLTALTYNLELYHGMHAFVQNLIADGFQNRTIGLITNHTWGSKAEEQMMELLKKGPKLSVLEPVVRLKSSLKEEDMESLITLADAIADSIRTE